MKPLISAQQIGLIEVTYRKNEIELKDLMAPEKTVTVRHDVLKIIQQTLRQNGSAEAERENSKESAGGNGEIVKNKKEEKAV